MMKESDINPTQYSHNYIHHRLCVSSLNLARLPTPPLPLLNKSYFNPIQTKVKYVSGQSDKFSIITNKRTSTTKLKIKND